MVAQTRGNGSASSPYKLQFKEKLVGKGYSTDVLLKKLKALHKELAEIDQERVDTKSLGTVRKELIQPQILLHKDKGVKAHVACCLADILRLYAPDAPYTADELRDIFQFFFRQLATGLKGSNSPYYNEYFHLLQSLSTVKSVVLVCDLHHADELMAEIFRDLFGLVRNDLPKNVEICVIDILVALIDEAQSVPHPVLDSIMTQFEQTHEPAYRVAVEVCNATADKLQRYVCQFFTDLIVQHDSEDIRHAHSLIVRVNRDCPTLLHNVVPQLEEELKVDELEVRLLAAQALGQMFADKGGGDLARKYPHVWEAWQGRKNDKASSVRIAFVETCNSIITLHADLRRSVEDALRLKLLDPDDKVRAAACKVYAQLDYESALHHVSIDQLKAVGGRCADKRPAVRSAAMHTLGKLYSIARPEIEKNDAPAIAHFSWIPQTIVHATKLGGPAIRVLCEQVVAEHILPLPAKGDDDAAWTDQLLTVTKFLDESATTALLGIAGLKQVRPTIFERFIQFCEENNGGVIDSNEEEITRKLNLVIDRISMLFPDRAQVAEHLNTFATLNEGRLYKLFKTCADVRTDLKTLVKATNEFLRRVEQASSTLVDTMTAILRKASLWVINTSSIPRLVQAEQDEPAAKAMLKHLAKFLPALYDSHLNMFAETLKDADGSDERTEVALQALAAVRWDGGDRKSRERVLEYALSANARHAKFAARIIGHMKKHEDLAVALVSRIADALPEAREVESLLVGHLAALAEVAKIVPDAFETQSEVIIGFLVKDVLMNFPEDAMDVDDDDDEWGTLTPQARAKLLCLKICRNRCIANAGGAKEEAMIVATPVLKMLFTLLANSGVMKEGADEHVWTMSRMRLQAATCLIQMATVPTFCEDIIPNFELLAVTIQDTCFHVRMGFLSKLIALLSTNKLNPKFNVIVFLTAHDPEREVRDQTRSYVAFALERSPPEIRVSSFEMQFLRLLHVLAHHPDFAIMTQNLQETAKYIEFYLDLVASADNIPLLYHLSLKSKTVRDATSPESSENLYCVGELAQEIIKNRAKLNSWQLNSYPGKVKLPSDIFKGLANAEAANKIMKKIYLPEDTASWLSELKKTARSPNAKPRGRPPGDAKNGKKRKSPPKPRAVGGTTKKPQKKKRKTDYNEDEDDEDDEGAGSDGDHATSNSEGSDVSDDDEGGEDSGDDKLGRGARGRAKRKAKREAKKQKKEKDGQ